MPFDSFTLKQLEEAFSNSIIVTVTSSAHAGLKHKIVLNQGDVLPFQSSWLIHLDAMAGAVTVMQHPWLSTLSEKPVRDEKGIPMEIDYCPGQ